MRVYVLGSGSSGNCLIVEAGGERLVVDAGMGPARAAERMQALGADFPSSPVPPWGSSSRTTTGITRPTPSPCRAR